MSRLVTSGFEMQQVNVGSVIGAAEGEGFRVFGSPSIDTTVKRSGEAALQVPSANTAQTCVAWQAGSTPPAGFGSYVAGRAYYLRTYVRISATPTAVINIIRIESGASVRLATVAINTSGQVELRNALAATLQTSSALSPNQWYRVSIMFQQAPSGRTTTNGTLELQIDGLSVGGPQTGVNAGVTDGSRWMVGATAATSQGVDVWFDDIALNDDQPSNQTSWPGEGKIVLLRPTSDNSTTGYTAGAGGASNLWDAVNNVPPVGLASPTDSSQIASPNNNATDGYNANVETYSAKGILAANLVMLVQAIAQVAASSTTVRGASVQANSNPGPNAFNGISTSTTSIGSSPTGWLTVRDVAAYSPSVTLGTAPVVRVINGTAVANTLYYDFIGLYVEYKPPLSLGVSSAFAGATLSLAAPTQVPLAPSSAVVSPSLTLTAPTAVFLVPASGVAGATLALTTPTQVPLNASSAQVVSTLALSAPALISLASSGLASAALALSAPTTIPLGVSTSASSVSLALAAPTTVSLAASLVIASATLALSAATVVPFAGSSGASSASFVLIVPTQVSLGAVSAQTSMALAITVPVQVSLVASTQTSTALALTAPSQVPLGAVSAQTATTLSITASAQVSLNVSAQASTALALTAPSQVSLNVSAQANTALALAAPASIILSSTAASVATLALTVPGSLPLGASSAQATASLALTAPTRLSLSTSAVVSASLDLIVISPAVLPLDPADAAASSSLAVVTPARLALVASATASSSLVLVGPGRLSLAVTASSSTSLGLIVRPLLSLGHSSATVAATVVMRALTGLPFAPVYATATGSLHLSLPGERWGYRRHLEPGYDVDLVPGYRSEEDPGIASTGAPGHRRQLEPGSGA